MQAGGVEDEHLNIVNGVIAEQPVARRLGLIADAGQFGADQGVEKRALTGIGSAMKPTLEYLTRLCQRGNRGQSGWRIFEV